MNFVIFNFISRLPNKPIRYEKIMYLIVIHALTTILPIVFLYLNTVIVIAGTFEPK